MRFTLTGGSLCTTIPLAQPNLSWNFKQMALHLSAAVPGHQPHISFQSDQIIVLDDFLESATFSRVLDYCARAKYYHVHSRYWRKVWRINDGDPLQGGTTFWSSNRDTFPADENKPLHPTGTDIDLFIDQLVSALPYAEQLIGAAGRDWFEFTAGPWIYPAGTSLSLHQDGTKYTGAYTFFAHRQWNIHWGGYLLVLDPRTAPLIYSGEILGENASWIDDTKENDRVFTPGFAQCIFPKPNRLVFIAPDAQHLLSRVDANAGHHPRISIAGFFRKESTRA
jgi:hypothetical protein